MQENSEKIKIAWLHNFDIQRNPSSGVFMYQLFNSLQSIDTSNQIDLVNIGSINNPLSLIVKFFKYRKIFKDYNILHAQYGSGTGFFTSLFSNTKIISLRGSDWYYSPSRNIKEKFHIWLGCKLTRLSLRRFNRIIVMSERMKVDVNEQFSSLNIDVIPDGIDLNKFYPKPKEQNSVFKVLFSTVDKTNPVKRFDLAQKAFTIFNNKYPNSELVFMTGVPHDNVNNYLNSVDVILLTSTHEGWPNIIKEGLACNIPFVSTDVSDLKKIANNTKSCFICDENAESIAESLEMVLKNGGSEDLRLILGEFDIQFISRKLNDLYNYYVQ